MSQPISDISIIVDDMELMKETEPHNGKPITKMAISPQSEYIVTYSQEDKSFVGWRVCWCFDWRVGKRVDVINDSGTISLDDNVQDFKDNNVQDFKVSDDKIIILNKDFVYDMKTKEKITLNNYDDSRDDEKRDFLTNGDIVTWHNSVISIYSSSDNWKRRTEYKLKKTDQIFGEVTNNKLLFLVDQIIFILDLLTFQYWKVLLDINEKEIDIEKIMLKFSNNLMVINVDGILYIYSIEIHVPIGRIKDNAQDFGIVGNNDEYIITLSNNNEINIHCWRQNLRKSIDFNLLKSKINFDNNNQFPHIEFKDNKAGFYLYDNKPQVINMTTDDWKALLEDQNSNVDNNYDNNLSITPNSSQLKEGVNDNENNSLDKNIFYKIDQFIITKVADENQFIRTYIIPSLETFDALQNIEEQNEYELRLKESTNHEYILETISSLDQTVISSYNTKLNSRGWDYQKASNNVSVFIEYMESIDNDNVSKKREFRIYRFNTKIKKIQLQYCFNIEFLEYAVRHYNNSNLSVSDIDKIAEYTENDGLKKQWILYLLNQRYFLVHYGRRLLKSAIVQNNIELIETIITKTLEYFKKNPDRNIYVLSIICENMNYLCQKYPEFLLKYYDDMILFIDSSSQDIIYNNLNHIYSFYIELKTHNSSISTFNRIFTRIVGFIGYIIGYIFAFIIGFIFSFIYDIFRNGIYCLTGCCIHGTVGCFIGWIRRDDRLGVIGVTNRIFYRFRNIFKHISNLRQNLKPQLKFVVPFPNYVTYPKDYRLFKELFYRPESSTFSQVQNNEFYKTWNGEAIVNFKWRLFGRYYYAAIWLLFMVFLICFTLASSVSFNIINEQVIYYLLISSIVLGFIHLSFEIRQFIWDPIKWILNVWNLFDLGAYLLPTIASIYSIRTGNMYIPLASISCLLLDIKFILFFQAFESFGVYFAIIIGVGQRIFSFLLILGLIIISFAHAFLVLLEPKYEFSNDSQGDLNDPNNPWVLATKYHQISEDGTINPNATLVQEPDENTNLFSNYPNSLLAVYLFLLGDRTSLSAWQPTDNPIMIILMIMFSFVIVVYLMNLFIGLLNMAIQEDNDRASYLAQKAEILKDIELFYLLPYQRRRTDWFPDIIYYYADVDKTRKAIKKLMDEGTWNTSDFPEMRERLLNLLAIKKS